MKNKDDYPIRNLNWFIGLVIYFLGFSFIFPKIAAYFVLMVDANAKYISLPYEMIIYCVTLLPIYFIVRPILIQEGEFSFKKVWVCTILFVLLMVIINIINDYVALYVLGNTVSENQAGLDTIRSQNVVLFFILTVFIGPLLEEFVFRGLIFRFFDKKYNFIIALLVSSLLFGFVHIDHSIWNGQFQEFFYLILYSSLGMMFCLTYKMNNSIYAAIILHMFYNFIAFL